MLNFFKAKRDLLQAKREIIDLEGEVKELNELLRINGAANSRLRDMVYKLRARIESHGMTPKELDFLSECTRAFNSGGGIKTVLFRKLMRGVVAQRKTTCQSRKWEG